MKALFETTFTAMDEKIDPAMAGLGKKMGSSSSSETAYCILGIAGFGVSLIFAFVGVAMPPIF